MSKVAAIQMASGPNVQSNFDSAAKLIDVAVKKDAKLVVLPENFALMAMTDEDRVSQAEQSGKGVMQDFLANQSRKHGIWLVGGTIPLKSDVDGKARAACLLFNDKGEQVARYDKIHMFDVVLGDNSESYNESRTTDAGDQAVVVDTPFGRLGLAVCYDLRFPELFRTMNDYGMEICVLPSAFTAITGKAHWEPLVRARAIENLCYMVASAQGGFHINGRETYGHSMIVDPWGNILDRMPGGTGVIVADIDKNFLKRTRKNFPVLQHRRLNCKIS
ncbi:MAG: carbon-nitrogen hydrolase family protein [Gammaproteobacteria bacterium]|nr:carbon-nitrogen hydrolase family protein [Gammaproteobacteria bacterium]MDH5735921.1 carbon-nitrogen hydrolase family protein [Gammaproteobacteria bacterium]